MLVKLWKTPQLCGRIILNIRLIPPRLCNIYNCNLHVLLLFPIYRGGPHEQHIASFFTRRKSYVCFIKYAEPA